MKRLPPKGVEMKESFLLWAKKKKLLDEGNDVPEHMAQWLWLGWQTAWRIATSTHMPAINKLRMERDAYSAELDKLLLQKHYFESLAEPEEKLEIPK
jgi:hypothetical protein